MNALQDEFSAAINHRGFIDTLTVAYPSWDPPSSTSKWNCGCHKNDSVCFLSFLSCAASLHCLLHKLYFVKDSFILLSLFFTLSLPFSRCSVEITALLLSTVPIPVGWWAGIWGGCSVKEELLVQDLEWRQRYLQSAWLKLSFRNS